MTKSSMNIATSLVTLSQSGKTATKIPLRRVIGLTTAILIVAGSMIGTGVFKKIVPMAATGLNGNQILLAWLIAGVVTLLGAFTIAGLARLTTVSGGLYEYMRLAFGNFAGFFFGWAGFIIILSGAIAAISFVFAQSVNSLIPLGDPLQRWKDISIWHFIYPFQSQGIKILAITAIALLTWFNYRGIKNGAGLNNLLTCLKIIGILALIVLGLYFSGTPSNVVPQTAISPLHQKPALYSAFFTAALSAFWAYNGFAAVAFITGEVKNPKRNLPIAIISGVSLVMLLYLLVNLAYLNAVPASQLAALEDNAIAGSYVAGDTIGNTGTLFVSILIMISSLGSLHVGIICHARVYYRMAQEKVFFRHAAKVHPVFRTPHNSLLYVTVWSIALVISGTFDMLTDMSILMIFIFYAFLAVGLIKLKRKKVIREKIPGYPWAPIIFILFTLALAVNTFITQPKLSLIGIGLVATGIPFYFYFKMKYKALTVIQDEEREETRLDMPVNTNKEEIIYNYR